MTGERVPDEDTELGTTSRLFARARQLRHGRDELTSARVVYFLIDENVKRAHLPSSRRDLIGPSG